jgi:hypothetical protein
MKATDTDILELEEFSASSFMGINSASPVIIDFTKRKKNQNVIELESDQETGKTSTICGILYAMGAAFNVDKKKLMNRQDGAIDVNLKFTYNGEQYNVIANSSRTELKKLNENGKWKSEDSPVAMLRKIFGPVSLSPFNVKLMKGKDQIAFFQEMFGSGEEATKKMRKVESDLESQFNTRTNVNREVKALTSALDIEPMYKNYEKTQERFAKAPNATNEKKKYEDLATKKNAYDQYANTLEIAKSSLKDKNKEIAELEAKLAAAKKDRDHLNESVTKGEKWMKDNEGITKEFEAASKEWVSLSQTLADYEKWKGILAKEKQMIEKQDVSIDLTGKIDELREQLLKLTKQCLPKVPGLTIKVAAGLDKEDKPEGVFYNDQPLHELSQSQYEGMWAKIFAESGCSFLFFENLNNFGSMTQGILNGLAKEGATIFGTRTNPKIKEIGVAFKTKIE